MFIRGSCVEPWSAWPSLRSSIESGVVNVQLDMYEMGGRLSSTRHRKLRSPVNPHKYFAIRSSMKKWRLGSQNPEAARAKGQEIYWLSSSIKHSFWNSSSPDTCLLLQRSGALFKRVFKTMYYAKNRFRKTVTTWNNLAVPHASLSFSSVSIL